MVLEGGTDRRSCFSTRMMWRSGGKGELYLVSLSAFLVIRIPHPADIPSTFQRTNRPPACVRPRPSRSANQPTASPSPAAHSPFLPASGPISAKTYGSTRQARTTAASTCLSTAAWSWPVKRSGIGVKAMGVSVSRAKAGAGMIMMMVWWFSRI
jgi:hypothetical protein